MRRSIVIAWFALGCEDPAPPTADQQGEAHIKAPPVEPRDVPRLAGQIVRVTGVVGEIVDERAFVLVDESVLFEARLVIVAESPIRITGLPLEAGQRVTVTGVVHTERPTTEERLGRVLPPAVVAAIGEPFVVLAAREVERAVPAVPR